MGALRRIYSPIPTPTLPLKGREYLEQVQTYSGRINNQLAGCKFSGINRCLY